MASSGLHWKGCIVAICIASIILSAAPVSGKFRVAKNQDPFPITPPTIEDALKEGRGRECFLPALLDEDQVWVIDGLKDPDCRIGLQNLQRGRWKAAFDSFEKAIDRSAMTSRSTSHAKYSNLTSKLDRCKNAFAIANAAIALDMLSQFQNANPTYQPAGVANESMRSQAEYLYEKALRVQPKDPILNRNMGVCKIAPQDKFKYFNQAAQLAPDDPRCLLALGNFLNRAHEWAASANVISRALKQYPNSAQLRFTLANTLISAGYYADAENEYSKVLASSPDCERALCERGIARACLRKYSESMKDLLKCRRINPKNIETYNFAGLVKGALGDYKGECVELRQALQLAPNCARFHYNLAYPLLRLKRTKEALFEANKAIELDPSQTDYHACLALILLETNKLDGAMKAADRAIQINPNNHNALETRAIVSLKLGDYEQSVADFAESKKQLINSVKRGPSGSVFDNDNVIHNIRDRAKYEAENAAINEVRIGVSFNSKQLAETLKAYDKMIRLSPGKPELLWDRAQVLMCGGKFVEAAADLAKFQTLVKEPNLRVSAELLRHICFLQANRNTDAHKSLEAAAAMRTPDKFQVASIEYGLGKRNEASYTGLARTDLEAAKALLQIAVMASNKGDIKRARDYFQRIEQYCGTDFEEYSLAIAFRNRLDKGGGQSSNAGVTVPKKEATASARKG